MLDKIQCIIMSYGQPACRELQQWLSGMKVDWRYGVGDYEIDVARNRNVKLFLDEDVPRGKEVLRSFGPPWFRMGHSGDMMTRTHCECNYFRDRANEVGFDGKMAGIIGHRASCVLLPDGKERWKMMFPFRFNYQEICNPKETTETDHEHSQSTGPAPGNTGPEGN